MKGWQYTDKRKGYITREDIKTKINHMTADILTNKWIMRTGEIYRQKAKNENGNARINRQTNE